MGKNRRNTAYFAQVAAFLCMCMCACMLLAACSGGDGETQTTDAAESTAQEQITAPGQESGEESDSGAEQTTKDETSTEEGTAEPEKMTYTVSVTGSDGNPGQGAVVRFYLGDEQVTMVPTAADGAAKAELVPDTYTVVIDNIPGEMYATENCTLSPDSPALEIQLHGLPTASEEIYAYSPAADDYVAYETGRISEGEYWVELSAGDMAYYLFVAPRAGTYRLEIDEDVPVSIGYFGSTSFVLTESTVPEENNAIMLDVYDDMVYNYAFVIGIGAEEGAPAACSLRVAYAGERETTVNDLPWVDLMPEGELDKFTKPAGTLTNFDITDESLTVVYNADDGYYHVGSVDGPVLLLNLDNNSPYMDALTTVCSNMRLGVYVYDDEGNVISKDSYNELIWAYNEVSDGGYYPLDQTLADMMLAVGNYIGWYDASSPMSLFGAQLIVPEHAHLFACVYVQ